MPEPSKTPLTTILAQTDDFQLEVGGVIRAWDLRGGTARPSKRWLGRLAGCCGRFRIRHLVED